MSIVKLKSILLAVASVGIFSIAEAQVVVGPEVAYTYSTMNMAFNGIEYKTNFVSGAKVGAALDISVKDNFYLQTGLYFGFLHGGSGSYISYKSLGSGVPSGTSDDRLYRIYAVQVPLMFTYKTDFKYHPNNFAFGVGPYLNVNYGGQYFRTFTTTLNGFDRPIYDDRNIKIGDVAVEHDIRRFEVGVMAAIAYEMEIGLNFKVFYGVGLNNLAPLSGGQANSLRSHGGGLGMSYYFNKPEKY